MSYVKMDAAITLANIEHALADQLAQRNLEMQHCFVVCEYVNEVAKDAFDRIIDF